MYRVVTDERTDEQISALPPVALNGFVEARALLEVHPWSGDPIHRDNPDGPVRTIGFGAAGLITYLVLDHDRRVDLLEVLWAG